MEQFEGIQAYSDELVYPDGKRAYIDWPVAEVVLEEIIEAYRNNDFPYSLDSTRLPQDPRHLPENLEYGSRDAAMFYFNLCYYMRGGIKSVEATRFLSNVYNDAPELFDPEFAAIFNPNQLREILATRRLSYPINQIPEFWIENSRRLVQKWDSDPRNLLIDCDGYDEALARIMNNGKGEGFKGFREKMVSMLAYYYMAEGLAEYQDMPLPVDLHVARISIATEMIKFEGFEDGDNLLGPKDITLNLIRSLYHQYVDKNEISMIELCNAVWLLSQSICGIQPGNQMLEPEGRKNRNGRSTQLVHNPIDFDSELQRKQYQRSCGTCPVEEHCKWNLPSKIYYIQGHLRKMGHRAIFPDPSQDSLLPWHTYMSSNQSNSVPKAQSSQIQAPIKDSLPSGEFLTLFN